MLAPDIFTTNGQLASLYNEVVGVSGYSIGVQDTFIGILPEEPKWLPAVRSEMRLLSQAGANWIDNYPEQWPTILTTFIDYGTTFTAFSGEISDLGSNLTKKVCVEFLTALSSELADNAKKTLSSLDAFTDYENQFTNVFPSLSSSIQAGWNELQDEEAEMIAIAEALTELQDEIAGLQSKISSGLISNGKSYAQTTVKIAYSILTAAGEVAVPYLSIVSLAYTIGKTFYDIISDTDKINADLLKIADLQVKASEEAQAAAATKATIQYLYNIELQFLTLQKHGSGLVTMWNNEKSKVDEAVNAINAGADPQSFLDIITMTTAQKNWARIQKFVQNIIDMQPTIGQQVILKPQINQ